MFSYHGNGFIRTSGNQGVAPTPKPAPKKVEAIKPKKKESKKPSIVTLDKKSIKAITSFKGNPYRPSEPSKNTLKAIVSAIKGKDSHYTKNKGADDQKNARAKDLKEKEKQTKLLEEIAGKKGGRGGSSLFGASGGVGGAVAKGALGGAIGALTAGLFKGGAKGILKRLGIAGLVYSAIDGYKDALASQMAQQGLSISDATLTDKMSAIIKNVGDSVMGVVAKYGNDALKILGIDYRLDPKIVSSTVNGIQAGVTTALDNIKNNTGELGNTLVDGLRGIDSTLGDATAKVSDITSSAISTATKIFSELGAMTKKQTPEVKEYLTALKKYRKEKSGNEIKAKFSKLSKEDIKAENDAKAEVAKKAKVALKHGLTKDFSESYYNEAIKLNDPASKLEAKAKQEQMKYEALTKGLSKNGSIFGIGGNSDAEIQAQRAKKDKAFTKMYEYKKANGGLTEKEVAQYNKIKKGHAASEIAGKEKHKAKLESKRSGTLANLVDMKTLKKEAEEGSWYAQQKIKFLHTSKENLDAEIKKEESKLDFQDKIIGELQETVDKLKTLKDSIPLETYTAPVGATTDSSSSESTQDGGISNKSTMQYEGFRGHIYKDSKGLDTIGYGHLLTADDKKTGRYNKGITKAEAKKLFDQDKAKHDKQLYDKMGWIKDQPKEVRKALEDMAFNMGVGNGKKGLSSFKNTLSLIKQGRYDEASSGILNSKYAKDVGQRAIDNANRVKSATMVQTAKYINPTRAAIATQATRKQPAPPKQNKVATQDKQVVHDTKHKATQASSNKATSPIAVATTNENMIVKAIKEQTNAIVEATSKGGQAPIVVANKSTNKEVSI